MKLLRPDVAVVLCAWRMDRLDRAGLLTLVMQGAGGGWRIVVLQNTDRSG